jgi:hypothetical protein
MELKDMLKEIVVPSVLTGMLVGTACYMTIIGQMVPEWLYGLVSVAAGYWFTYASAAQAYRASRV